MSIIYSSVYETNFVDGFLILLLIINELRTKRINFSFETVHKNDDYEYQERKRMD